MPDTQKPDASPPNLGRPDLLWWGCAIAALLLAAFAARSVFLMLPRNVPYEGTVGLLLLLQLPPRNKDLAYIVFLAASMLLPFAAWRRLSPIFARRTGSAPAKNNSSDIPHLSRRWIGRIFLLLAFAELVFEWFVNSRDPADAFIPTDLFHWGERLVPAMLASVGKRPYLDFWCIRGLGLDALPSLLAQWFGSGTLAGAILAQQTLAVIAWIFYLLIVARLAGSGFAAIIYFSCRLLFAPFFLDLLRWDLISDMPYRIAPLLVLALLLRRALQKNGDARLSFLTGLLAAGTMVYSVDVGYTALGAMAVYGAAWAAFHFRGPRTIQPALWAFAGIAAGGAAIVGWLKSMGTWIEVAQVMRINAGILSAKSMHDSLPFAPIPWRAWPVWFAQPILIGILGVAWLSRLAGEKTGRLRGWETERLGKRPASQPYSLPASQSASDDSWQVLWPVLIVMSALWYKKALDRFGVVHVPVGNVLCPLLLAVLFPWLRRSSRAATGLVVLVAAMLIAPFVTNPIPSFQRQAVANFATQADRSAPDVPGALAARFGFAPPAAGQNMFGVPVQFLDRTLGPGETYFDFTNAGLLYFLLGRTPPTRYVQAFHIMTEDQQQEVVAALSAHPPATVLFRLGNGYRFQDIDGVDNQLRLTLVSAWLLAHYRPVFLADGSETLVSDPALAAQSGPPVFAPDPNLGALPLRFAEKPPPWFVERAAPLAWDTATNTATIADHAAIAALILRIDADIPLGLRVRWGEAEGQGVSFQVQRGVHAYLIPVGSLAGWAWSVDPLTLRLPPGVQNVYAVRAWPGKQS